VGSLSLALSTQAAGITYRLSHATFTVTGPQPATLKSDDDVDVIEQTLLKGNYSIQLQDGWHLQRSTSGVFETVMAELTSADPRSFTIAPGHNTPVSYQFHIPGTGMLDLSIEVLDDSIGDAGVPQSDGTVAPDATLAACPPTPVIVSNPSLDGNPRTLASLACPAAEVLVGLVYQSFANSNDVTDGVAPICSPRSDLTLRHQLPSDDIAAAAGGVVTEVDCPPGSIAIGLSYANFAPAELQVDGLTLLCQATTAGPTLVPNPDLFDSEPTTAMSCPAGFVGAGVAYKDVQDGDAMQSPTILCQPAACQ
jgi:hypothetical protein